MLSLIAPSTGLRVGNALAERHTRERPRMTEQLDVIKWACKDLWGEVFRKQVRKAMRLQGSNCKLPPGVIKWTCKWLWGEVSRNRCVSNDVASRHWMASSGPVQGAQRAQTEQRSQTLALAHLQ